MTARPEEGPGSVAGIGVRLGAFVVDSVIAIAIALAAGLRPSQHVAGATQPSWSYNFVVYGAFLAVELVFVAVAGQTPGMRVAGLAVMSAGDGSRPRLRWAAVRTLLLAAVVPALITDSSGRAMHDRAAGTVTVRTR